MLDEAVAQKTEDLLLPCLTPVSPCISLPGLCQTWTVWQLYCTHYVLNLTDYTKCKAVKKQPLTFLIGIEFKSSLIILL